MGKPDGFLTIERKTAQERPPQVRLCDWDAFHPPMDEDALREQSMRCMNCGTPFCHGGVVWNGVASGCPLGNLIPEWNDLVYRKLYREAYERLAMTSPFPEFTSRVCPALCEGACTAGLNDKAVTVREIERYLSDTAWEKGWVDDKVPAKRTGKRVAVIGSGPAGLGAAYELNSSGHSVTVFEKSDRPGGLLMYGIPNMKLPKEIILRRAELMAKQGVEFAFNRDGVALTKDELDAFDAVIFCAGAGQPRDVAAPGRELNNIRFAVPYLTEATKALLDGGDSRPLEGKRVVVIGGGDTGNDCVATTLRQGAAGIVQLEIMPQPPECRTEANAWPQWPLVLKTDYGQQEAINVIGQDPRIYCIQTTKFVGENGNVVAIETINVEWVRENGRMVPKSIAGTENRFDADLVLIAVGFSGAETALLNALGNPKADGYSLSKSNWFSAGDFRTGQSLVVKAINDGMEAAKKAIAYLSARG